MSVERAIVEAWGRYKPLTDLVPTDRAQPGISKQGEAELPYVGLLRTGSQTQRTSDSLIETVALQITIKDTDHARAQQVRRVIRDWFNRGTMEADGVTILDCRPGSSKESQGADGLWTLTTDWQIRTTESRHPAPVGA